MFMEKDDGRLGTLDSFFKFYIEREIWGKREILLKEVVYKSKFEI